MNKIQTFKSGEYELIKQLGKGAFGTVYLVEKKDGKQLYAMKAFQGAATDHDIARDVCTELKNLKKTSKEKNESIIDYVDFFGEFGAQFIVTEYCEDGDLGSLIEFYKQEQQFLSEDKVLEFTLQILNGLSQLHGLKLIHRDIKPAVKLGDLGLAHSLDSITSTFKAGGTPCYMAPEVITEKGYFLKSDIWSLACVVYEMVILKRAYDGKTIKELFESILNDKVPELETSFIIRSILNKMFQKEVEHRPESSDLRDKVYKIIRRKKEEERKMIEAVLDEDTAQTTFKNGRYKLLKKLGKKLLGTVFLVEDIQDNERKAIKMISNAVSKEEIKQILKEKELLQSLKSSYIVGYVDYFVDLNSTCIVSEYCSNGDLAEYIEKYKKRKESIPYEKYHRIAVHLMRGLNFLHTLSPPIVHRNIKPGNIFIDFNKIKIGDLGVATKLESISKAYTQTGTPAYLSPEIINNIGCTGKADVWSAACVIYETVTLDRPFKGRGLYEVFREINNRDVIPKLTPVDHKFNPVLEKMFKREPEERASSNSVLKYLEKLK